MALEGGPSAVRSAVPAQAAPPPGEPPTRERRRQSPQNADPGKHANPWLIGLAWLGAMVFLLGVVVVSVGAAQVYEHEDFGDGYVVFLAGIGTLLTSVVIWSTAMAAAAVSWQVRRAK